MPGGFPFAVPPLTLPWSGVGNLDARCTTPVLPFFPMAVRKKRSVSIPPDLDSEIEAAAAEAGMSYSAWLSAVARKEFTIRAGLKAVTEFEREHGAFSPEEIAEADVWAQEVLGPSRAGGSRRRRSA